MATGFGTDVIKSPIIEEQHSKSYLINEFYITTGSILWPIPILSTGVWAKWPCRKNKTLILRRMWECIVTINKIIRKIEIIFEKKRNICKKYKRLCSKEWSPILYRAKEVLTYPIQYEFEGVLGIRWGGVN